MKVMNILAENIRLLRQQKGMSQKDLAAAIGTSHPRISDMENGTGNPTVTTLDAIARALGVTVPVLLSPRNPKNFSQIA